MKLLKRRPYVDYKGEPITGYMESDHLYVYSNRELCVAFLEFLESLETGIQIEIKGRENFNKVTMIKTNKNTKEKNETKQK